MDLSAPRVLRVLSAAVLLALASSSRAADPASVAGAPSSASIGNLPSDIGRPEGFQRFVEGSRAKQGDVDAPRAFAADGGGPAAPLSPNRPRTGPRLEGAVVPSTAAAAASVRRSPRAPVDWTPTVPSLKLAAVAGLGFILIAGSMLGTPRESAPAPEAVEGFAPVPVRSDVRTPDAAWGPAREERPRPEPFIDTRMPVATWRAVSRREQELIERWNASSEKALGLASLSEWLDAKGSGEGVDIPLLQAKLRRDA